MGHCAKSSTRARQVGLLSFRMSARIMERRAHCEDESRARPSSFRCFVVSSRTRLVFMESASLHDPGGHAEGRKSFLPCSCAGLRTVAHLNGRATCVDLARAAEEHVLRTNANLSMFVGTAQQKLASRGGGVTTLRNHFSSYQSALVQCTNIPG